MRVERLDTGFDGVTIFAFTLDDGRRMNVDVIAPERASVDWQVGVELEGVEGGFQSVAISPWLAYEQVVQALSAQGVRNIDWHEVRAQLDVNGAFPIC